MNKSQKQQNHQFKTSFMNHRYPLRQHRRKTKKIKKQKEKQHQGLSKINPDIGLQTFDKNISQQTSQQFLKGFYEKQLSLIFSPIDQYIKPFKIIQNLFSQSSIPLQDLLNIKSNSCLWDSKCQETQVLDYFSLHKMIEQPRCQIFTVKGRGFQYILKLKLQGLKRKKLFSMFRLSPEELLIIESYDSFMEKLNSHETKSKSSQEIQDSLGLLSKQILFLYNIYFKNLKNLQASKTILENIRFNIEREKSLNKLNKFSIQRVYILYLIAKNLKNGLQDLDLIEFEELNYFKKLSFSQQQKYGYYTPIQNLDELKQYLRQRQLSKSSKYKKLKKTLPTACECCFSNNFEMFNPINKCIGCERRAHNLCNNISNGCQICLLKQAKSQKRCMICPFNDLMIKSFQQENMKRRYVHNFCMLFHKLWKLSQNNTIEININNSNSSSAQFKCQICQQVLSLYTSCVNCKKKFHATCAFFNGFQFNVIIKDQPFSHDDYQSNQTQFSCLENNYQIIMICCSQYLKEKMEEKKFKRKYKLNWNKFIYKNYFSKGLKQQQNSQENQKYNENSNEVIDQQHQSQEHQIKQIQQNIQNEILSDLISLN